MYNGYIIILCLAIKLYKKLVAMTLYLFVQYTVLHPIVVW